MFSTRNALALHLNTLLTAEGDTRVLVDHRTIVALFPTDDRHDNLPGEEVPEFDVLEAWAESHGWKVNYLEISEATAAPPLVFSSVAKEIRSWHL